MLSLEEPVPLPVEWTKIFPEPRLCKAVVDRLTFNAHIIETGTESWRFKKTLERQGRRPAPAEPKARAAS